MANIRDLAVGQVLTAPSPATSGTTLVLASGQGADMPTTVPYKVLAYPSGVLPTKLNSEILKVTAQAGDTLTILRAQGETTAKSIAAGWLISNNIFTDDINNTSFVTNEVPVGTVNGVNTAFTTASPYVSGSLRVFKNGIRLKGGGNDYTETGSGFTMVAAPATGSLLLVDYSAGATGALLVGTNSIITDETPTGTVNGTNAVFTTLRPYIAGTLQVYVNGIRQARTTHVTETTPSAGTFTLDTAPLTGSVVRVDYHFNLNPASNADTVDGINANTTATANQLYPLNASAKYNHLVLPGTVLGTSQTQASVAWTAGEMTILTLTVTITQDMVDSGRKLKLSAFAPQAYSADNATRARFSLSEGATLLQRSYKGTPVGGTTASEFNMSTPAMTMPSVGSHTYTWSFIRDVGTSIPTVYAEANAPIYLEAEIK